MKEEKTKAEKVEKIESNESTVEAYILSREELGYLDQIISEIPTKYGLSFVQIFQKVQAKGLFEITGETIKKKSDNQ